MSEIGFVIITHGDMGMEMLRVATYIMGKKLGNIVSVKVPFISEMAGGELIGSEKPFQDRREWLKRQVLDAVSEVDQGNGVIILSDIIGGTAFNLANLLLEGGGRAVIGGVNLPMLLKLPSVKKLLLPNAVKELVERSRKAIDSRQAGEEI